jgi:carbon monoxide dehydrogenase subunit G
MGALRIEHSVSVARPPDAVFAFLADPANLPAWQGSCVEARAEDGLPIALGSRIAETRSLLGRRAEQVLEVTELEPPRLLELETVSGPVDFTVRHELAAEGDGTRVTIVAAGEPRGIAALARRMLAHVIAEETRRDLERLRELLETPSDRPDPAPRSG